ncbi:MAG: YraN family protein [Verrucomicrobiae bacterium]|nr:YraN family protein [Verrucomicrobiae bacterium]
MEPGQWKGELGQRGERWAARHLRQKGYKVLVRRFRSKAGEIDLVCRDGNWLVFVEVKTRGDETFGAPSEAVDKQKQRHICRVALDYLRLLGYPEVLFRFDVVEVIFPKGARRPYQVRLIQNAFEMSEPYFY